MSENAELFAGDNPFLLARKWLAEAQKTEINDPNAMALSTVDHDGMPNVRMVLLKDIEDDAFVFYTNYGSQKAQEIDGAGKAAIVLHWKSLRRQIRVRGTVVREDGDVADEYFNSRPLKSRIGAYASKQSQVLEHKADLVKRVAEYGLKLGISPPRPDFWGGYRIQPTEFEFWSDGAFRLHDRFQWRRDVNVKTWTKVRLNP
ncbi:pyridoxamine 5'-phosphate oxidase [Amylibacter sp. SFDW26]|uniref:pyridoxamine 5'-phosphate oxidase n=1 Tax=Amylibacter sp. SFDW26 TaxID=2652722 RepID=UPI001261AE5C|nr:pyridoxamine 5'-phosphate oxidase [Amylibacter sp. SFDW26]KAB7616332.1 pyridoxamine 5'-phosphate oxidase [Amylibacter sp. SFDW26]